MPSQGRLVALVATLIFSVLMAPLGAEAQNIRPLLPTPYRDEPYVNELLKMFEEWNAKSLVLPEKAKLRVPFEQRLKIVLGRKKYAYQDEGWAKDMRAKFEAMPAVVKAELPLSAAPQATLTALYLKDTASFRKEVAFPKVREQLMLPLFLILGKAQEEAKDKKRSAIESFSVDQSLFFWWTTSWPFCD